MAKVLHSEEITSEQQSLLYQLFKLDHSRLHFATFLKKHMEDNKGRMTELSLESYSALAAIILECLTEANEAVRLS